MLDTVKDIKEGFLERPLEKGAPLTYWRLGVTAEERYDVPDQPMSGEMDPFFFVTKHKNFIPHEYPCRTRFAAERRDTHPRVSGTFAPARTWLPFGSPRVDLSGFWFRPTILSTFAQTVIHVAEPGAARLRLGTCGGAVLFINGAEAGWMAPYSRNLEAQAEFEVALEAGENTISLYFDDLAERDARYYFQLDYLDGPGATLRLPTATDGAVAEAIEAMLTSMRFEKPAYTAGEVALETDKPLPFAARADIRIEGDFMSTERMDWSAEIPAGARRIAVAPATDLPSDFRHFHVSLTAGGFTAGRVFGVEICNADAQGEAPQALDARIAAALETVAAQGEPDTVTALARLASGAPAAETEAMIARSLPAIEDCHDCADFILVPLLWSRIGFAGALSDGLRARIDKAILNYRYWMDEPGNDVQWYFSENHALLFHTAAYLAGNLLKDARFVRSGRLGAEQSATGLARVRAWLDHFEAWEMAEFNSAPYFPIDLKGLTALFALAPDRDVRERARQAILRLVEMVANSAHHGVLTGAQGRSYEHTLRAGRSLELSGIARLLWGRGHFGRRFHALPQLALCLRDHGLEIPAEFATRASLPEGQAQEWCFAQGQDRFAALYHYKTSGFALGSAAAYRWNEWGYQETVLHARLGTNPDAQVWINHPGEVIHSGFGRPSYWGGCGTLPRVQQYRGLAIVHFAIHESQPGFTHAWFPQQVFDATAIEGNRAVATSGDGAIVLIGSEPLVPVADGPTAGNELRQTGEQTTWIVRTAAGARPEALAERFAGLTIREDADGTLRIDDPEYGDVQFFADGRVAAEGRVLDPRTWTVKGERLALGSAAS
ncbi:hypothetical protein [Pelagibacterium xiamenense]|uniref:hypothetical protein n=1 Tax=Pelagibacterium xiamenense TaxID=2901140 RepID=UPI001E28E394|nr:hypothetical protein [Pelagibacterium xiamenense]MCD7061379.1 hypothetical protein [Pelagibacterium xiamenense]